MYAPAAASPPRPWSTGAWRTKLSFYWQYTLVELYSENDFYDYDRCKIESDLIVKKKNIYKDGIYYMKFLLKGTEDDVRENLW